MTSNIHTDDQQDVAEHAELPTKSQRASARYGSKAADDVELHRLVAESRKLQGLPLKVTEPVVVARLRQVWTASAN